MRTTIRRDFFLFISPVVLGLLSCAKQAPPPGGPPDQTPPEVVAVVPAAGATQVDPETRLKFTFSENIDRRSFENALFMAPDPTLQGSTRSKLKFHGGGKEVEVEIPGRLREQTTYVVTLGSDLRDLRNNKMTNSYSFAFSTGQEIDQGEISGRVYGDNAANALVLAYRLGSEPPDPASQFADYFTQSGSDGSFTLSHLSTGRYRVFAITDRNGDRLYTRGEDRIGVPAKEVMLDDEVQPKPAATGLRFQLAIEDTTQPALVSATARSIQQVELRFDEEVVPVDSVWNNHVTIEKDERRLPINHIETHPIERNLVFVILATYLDSSAYLVTVDSLTDRSGNPVDSSYNHTEFFGITQPDSVKPRIVRMAISDSTRNVRLDQPLELYFSEIMQTDSLQSPVSVRTDTAIIPGKHVWLNSFQYRFVPTSRWQSKTKYLVNIQSDSTHDWNGNTLFDTTRQVVFWTLNADTLASISGTMSDEDSSASGPIHLRIRQHGSEIQYETRIDTVGEYHFNRILPGVYLLDAFRDSNDNHRFDPGTAYPFVPSERFMFWSDSIKVRSRWPNEGNDFVLPE